MWDTVCAWTVYSYLHAVFDDLHTKANCFGVVIPGRKGMPKSFGRKIELKWYDIKTAVRGNLTDVVWRDR